MIYSWSTKSYSHADNAVILEIEGQNKQTIESYVIVIIWGLTKILHDNKMGGVGVGRWGAPLPSPFLVKFCIIFKEFSLRLISN